METPLAPPQDAPILKRLTLTINFSPRMDIIMYWKTDFFFDLIPLSNEWRQKADLKANCLNARERISDLPGGELQYWDALAQWENEGGAAFSSTGKAAT